MSNVFAKFLSGNTARVKLTEVSSPLKEHKQHGVEKDRLKGISSSNSEFQGVYARNCIKEQKAVPFGTFVQLLRTSWLPLNRLNEVRSNFTYKAWC